MSPLVVLRVTIADGIVFTIANCLFYKTLNAGVGDAFRTLIHTCERNGIDPLEYLIELQRHSAPLAAPPARWMPWNYRQDCGMAQRWGGRLISEPCICSGTRRV